MKSSSTIDIFTDGASRGNPGPASIGIVFKDSSGKTILTHSEALGEQTNNYAEYLAVMRALEISLQKGFDFVNFYSDSQLLIYQMLGKYKVKSPSILQLYTNCVSLVKKLKKVSWNHIPRELNSEADALANHALDQTL